ncbi:MAG: MATE family efflux transporter [Salinivirgaceae bacterium]|nr:MATE family efflux transporter [Salinivirgaceae bacterium]
MSINSNIADLEFKSIPKLLWKFFLPAFTGVIINSLYNIVDRIFIGQGVGAYALSGLSAVFPVMLIMMAFGMMIGMGAGVRISINMGRKDFKRAELVLGNAFALIIIVSLFVTGLGFLIKGPMLRLFGASDLTMGYANEYLNIILLGTILNMTGFSLNNLIRSEGNVKIAMYSMLISAGTNIILDPIFIFVFDMGVAGAAYATIISMFILCIWVIWHFRSQRSVLKLKKENLKIVPEIVIYIVTIGFAPFAMQFASSFVQGTFNTQLVKFGGDLAIGAMGIINSVAMFVVMTMIAINMAAQPIIGFNYGAEHYKRVKETLLIGIKAASLISIFAWILVELFPAPIIKIFNNDNQELLNIGKQGLRLIFAAFPIVGFQIIVGNYFQSIGKAKISAILTLLRQVFLLIPAILIFPRFWGLDGVWLSAPIADTISAAIVFVFLRNEIKTLNKKINFNPN